MFFRCQRRFIIEQSQAGLGVLRIDKVEFNHQLTTVADAEAQRVGTGIELVQSFFGLGVVEKCARPTFGAAQNIAVGEAATEDDKVDVVQRLAPADKVGHRDILHVEARQIECVGHLAVAIRSFFANDGGLDSRWRLAVGRDAIAFERAAEAVVEVQVERLLLVVHEALFSHAVAALVAIEQVGCGIPLVAQHVDVKFVCKIAFLDGEGALFRCGIAYLSKADTFVVEECFQRLFVGVAHLNDHTGVLGKQHFDDVVARDVVQVDVHAASGVGKGHL